jgi:hypothetical protein
MLDLYDVGGGRWGELMEIAQDARQPGWWKAYGLGNSSYIAFETEASRVHIFGLGYVPGLLQTADYARALMEAVPVRRSDEQLDMEIAARMHRQLRLTSDDRPLELVTVIDETVLHRPIGGQEVLRRQLDRIVELAGQDTVELRVLPTSVGAHAGLASGVIILDFGDLGEPDMAYVEHTVGSLTLEKDGEVARAKLAFERLQSDSLDPAESVAMIRQLAGS